MTDPVFLFGSFTEDEANSYQSSIVQSSPGTTKQLPTKFVKEKDCRSSSPPIKHNGKQNGHPPPSKGVSNLNNRISANGKAALGVVDALGKPLGQSPKKHPARPGAAVTVGGTQSTVKVPVDPVNISAGHTPAPTVADLAPHREVTNNPNINSSAYPSEGSVFPAENADQADWLVVNTLDISGAKVVARNQGESLSVFGNNIVAEGALTEPAVKATAPSANVEALRKNGASADEDSEAVPPKLLPKSWAALVGVVGESNILPKQSAIVKGKGKSLTSQAGSQNLQPREEVVAQVTVLSGDKWLKSLREAGVSGRRLQPRGLINTGNSCFLNSTVQAMLSCSAFTHLLQVLKARSVPQTGYPTLQAFVEFCGEFTPAPSQNLTKSRRDGDAKTSVIADVGKPFAPAMFDTVLQSFTPDQPSRGTGRNRQEDAQEFLSFVIDRMHEEILRLQGKGSTSLQSISSVTSIEDDDWEMVGPKNRSAVTRTHTFSESAITDIFGGQLRSVVKTKGNKASATVQPFLVLHLDIVPEVVHSVEDALRFFAAPESLEGYKPATAKVGEVVSASKSVKIQTLPRVLILHLMRFSYGSGGSSKLHKPVQFPRELTLGRELLASTTTSGNEIRKYELVATVSHHGKDPSVGHYTADSKQATGQWLRFDDGVVTGVGLSRVLQEQAYVLFYKRASF